MWQESFLGFSLRPSWCYRVSITTGDMMTLSKGLAQANGGFVAQFNSPYGAQVGDILVFNLASHPQIPKGSLVKVTYLEGLRRTRLICQLPGCQTPTEFPSVARVTGQPVGLEWAQAQGGLPGQFFQRAPQQGSVLDKVVPGNQTSRGVFWLRLPFWSGLHGNQTTRFRRASEFGVV